MARQVETQNLIERWYELATGSDISKEDLSDIYFQFMAVWVAFNALYNSRRSAKRKQDWEKVEEFANEDAAQTEHSRLLQDNDEYRKAVQELKEYWAHKVKDEYNLSEVLYAVRKVRNNLFHGRKIPGNLEDERLVKASYVVLLSSCSANPT